MCCIDASCVSSLVRSSFVFLDDACLYREELTFEMLSLEPRASDDETLESEASIGTADSSENLNVDSEETISDFSGMPYWSF